MIEFWNIAIQPHNLPLTVLMGLVVAYWLFCLVGLAGVDMIDVDLDFDPDLDADASAGGNHIPSPIASLLRFVNATDVPLMAVLSCLSFFTWLGSMTFNYYFNPELSNTLILAFFFGAGLIGLILTKIVTAPLVPICRKLKELEKPEPAIGGKGVVVSRQVDQNYGQVEQKRLKGAPATLNCRTSSEEPIPRGSEVIVVSYDDSRGIYLVRPL